MPILDLSPDANFVHLPVMQMSPYRDEDAKCLVVQMLSNGHVMMQMLLVGMS